MKNRFISYEKVCNLTNQKKLMPDTSFGKAIDSHGLKKLDKSLTRLQKIPDSVTHKNHQ